MTTPSELQLRIEAERRGRAFVECRDGSGAQTLRELPAQGAMSIGRDADADLRIALDPQVSRVHAELERIGGDWVIADDGLSRNGTFVGGERVVGRRRLRDGDAIRVGSTTLVFREPAGGEEGRTATAGEPVDPATLTDVQRRVLIALCRPYRDGSEYASPATNRAIAAEVSLSVQAVKAHLRAVCERFEVGDLPQNRKRTRLAELAIRSGTVAPRDLDLH